MSFYESPLFIDILIVCIYAMLAVTIALIAWSMMRSLKWRKRQAKEQGIATGRIIWGVALLLTATLTATYLMADTTPLLINGTPYNDKFWLTVSDMLLNTVAVLMTVAVVCVALASLNIGRRIK